MVLAIVADESNFVGFFSEKVDELPVSLLV